MINLVRVDERLIHGQVAVVWTKYLKSDRILVVNDEVVKNETQKMALSMAVPPNVKANFKTIDDAVLILTDPRSKKMNIFVIVATINDAFQLVNKLSGEIKEVNLGNYGRMNNLQGEKREQISRNIFITEEDKLIIDNIKKSVNCVFIQTIPSDSKEIL